MKKTITTIAMAMVFTFGATFANAGILVGDRTAPQTTCSEKDGILVGDRGGILVGDRTGILVGDIVSYVVGILVGDLSSTSTPCTQQKDGILVGD